MTHEERVGAIQAFGYTKQESQFLCLAALHSGYFLRRQFSCFLPQVRGFLDDALVRKMLAFGHATEQQTGRRTLLYHICSRAFYGVIGDPDNRHRRRRPPIAIKAKLMALDFVLAHSDKRFLATEDDKCRFFTQELGIRKKDLPAKTYRSADGRSITHRYFVDKFPVFINAERQMSSTPVVSFCYVDEGGISTPGFETYLHQYARLFQLLGNVVIVYIATAENRFLPAQKVLDSFLRTVDGSHPVHNHDQLFEFLELENIYQTKRFDLLDVTKLERLRVLRRQFNPGECARFLEAWRVGEKDAVSGILKSKNTGSSSLHYELQTYLLDHDYDIFGHPKKQPNRPGRSN